MESRFPMIRLENIIQEEREVIGIPDGCDLPVFGVTNKEGITITGVKTSEDKSKYLRLRPRCFAYNPYRINVGSIGLSSYVQDGIVSPAYVIFSPLPKLDPDYLIYYLKSSSGNTQINFYGNRGSVRSALRYNDLCLIEIPLPPLPEQRRIVAKIEELAIKIEEAKRLRDVNKVRISGLLPSCIMQILKNCKDSKIIPLKEVCTEIIDCLHSNPIYADHGVPTVRSPDVGWGELNIEGALRTSEVEYFRRTRRGEPQEGDIILVREGGGTGKAGIVGRGQKFSLGQRVMMLRPKVDTVVPKFLLYQWLSPLIYDDQIIERLKGSASPHLNIKTLKFFTFVLPPLEEQHRIVAYLDGLQAQVDALKKLQAQTAAELDALLPAILDKAFKGEL